jgi:hypothetical protein
MKKKAKVVAPSLKKKSKVVAPSRKKKAKVVAPSRKKKPKDVVSLRKEKAVSAIQTVQSEFPKEDWEAFVQEAYLNLLDRPADPEGLSSYVAQLASGATKEIVLAQLEACPEGQRIALHRRWLKNIYGDP